MSDSPERQETRIVVELVSSAEVKRLESRDDELRAELERVNARVERLHATLYEYLEKVASRGRK